MIIALALVGLYVAVGRSLPFLFAYAVDEGIRKANRDIVFLVACAYFTIEILRSVLAFHQGRYIQNFGNLVLFEIRSA